MDEEPLDAERPHDEAWWVSELHRNEKLMDKYMAVLGDNPDWDKWKNPDDLYNKVHFNIDPPDRTEDEEDKSKKTLRRPTTPKSPTTQKSSCPRRMKQSKTRSMIQIGTTPTKTPR